MWIISCFYPTGSRRDLEAHRMRGDAEANAQKLRKLMGEKFQIVVCFEMVNQVEEVNHAA